MSEKITTLSLRSKFHAFWDLLFPIKVGQTVAIKSSGKIKAWEIRGVVLDITTSEDSEKIYLILFADEQWTEFFFRDEIKKVWNYF